MARRPGKNSTKDIHPKFIVSACLAGIDCTYNGKSKLKHHIRELVIGGAAITVCPEVLGGSPLRRESCEISDGDGGSVLAKEAVVKTISGRDVTGILVSGARKTLAIAKKHGIKSAILKSKSPSCGCGEIYDGTFRGILIRGDGVTAAVLRKHNIKIYNEKDKLLCRPKSTT